jgi:mannose-6-phosphate isomerase-like protein (cupin superfamily)
LGYRRVVTGTDDAGRSIVEIDEILDSWHAVNGFEMLDVWAHVPPDLADTAVSVRDSCPDSYALPAGGSRMIVVRVPPWDEVLAAREATPVENISDDGFHVTPTIDYVYVLDGTATMLLDSGDVELGKGDVVVQRATRHAWRTRAGVTLLGIAVDIPARVFQ